MVRTKNIFLWALVIVLIVAGSIWLVQSGNKPSELDEFAQCLEAEGATFYGAFWCGHCQNQKGLFGKSAEFLPYIECSEADGQKQTQVCVAEKIESYPTWAFSDGFSITSNTEPIECPIQPGLSGQPSICGLEAGQIGSQNFKVWQFESLFGTKDLIVRSTSEPIQEGNQWTFDAASFANGELPLEFLAEQTGCQLPN